MKVLVDGKEVVLESESGATFGSVMAAIYAKVAVEGRVVGKVSVDGQDVSLHAEGESTGIPVTDGSAISVTTNSPEELYLNSVRGIVQLGEAIASDLVKAIDGFRAGDVSSGQSYYYACIESLSNFFSVGNAILQGLRAGYFKVPDGVAMPAKGPSETTAEVLQRVLDAQKREDWTALADILEYEVTPNLSEWTGYFRGLKG